MASDMKIWIKTKNKEEYERVLSEIHPMLGFVSDRFDSKSCNFEPYDNECCDKIIDILDEIDIDYEMV